MGMRGPGARPLRTARETLPKRKRALPWKKKGLSRADRVIAFCEWLPVTKGIRAGKRMRLLEDQKAFIRDVYRDKPRVRIGISSKPRGNGKTGLVAGLALATLLGPESEPRGEVYSAAVDRTQSSKLFNEIAAIIQAVPEFDSRTNIVKHSKVIEVLDGDGDGSIFEALSSDARKGHSLAPLLWIYDELAQVDNFELLDNLRGGLGKRNRDLGLIISTQAPSDDHRLSLLIDEGLSGVDPSMVVHLLAAPADADPFDVATIEAVNPALGIFLNREDILGEAESARRSPAYEPRFRNQRLNQRVDANDEARLCTVATWKANANPVDRAALKGRRCYAGLDLSKKEDLTALVLAFPDDGPDPSYSILPFAWTPQEQIASRTSVERERFEQWIRAGDLIAVPGKTINYRFIAAQLASLSAEFDLAVVA